MNIKIDGSKIYYEKEGRGDPIIFLHADALDSRQWDTQFAYFAKKYTVVRYDIRGFGKSHNPTDAPYSFSEDLFLFMKHLSLDKAHVVGLSLGAAISIDFALTYPQKVRSLVLADAGISGDGFDESFLKNINIITHLAKDGDLARAKEAWLNLSIFDYSRKNFDVWNSVKEMVNDTSGYRWYGKNQPIEIDPPAIKRLPNIKAPTLVLVGEHDTPDFQRKSKLLHEKIQGSQFAIIPNAGHLSNIDNPEEFNKTVDSFLSNDIIQT